MPLLNAASKMYAGSVPAQRVYLGSSLVWEAVWKPTSIPGLTLWIDAKQQVDSDGARITVVRDWSPTNRTLMFPAGNEPIYRTNVGGQPCFDWIPGYAYGLDCGQWDAGPAGLTYLFVGRQHAGASYPMMVVLGPDADGVEMRHQGNAQELVLRYSSQGIVYTHPSNSSEATGFHIWSLRNTVGGASTAWTDRVPHAGSAAAAFGSTQALYAGRRQGGYAFYGMMREVLAYAGPVSDANMTKLFDYLQAKWTMTI